MIDKKAYISLHTSFFFIVIRFIPFFIIIIFCLFSLFLICKFNCYPFVCFCLITVACFFSLVRFPFGLGFFFFNCYVCLLFLIVVFALLMVILCCCFLMFVWFCFFSVCLFLVFLPNQIFKKHNIFCIVVVRDHYSINIHVRYEKSYTKNRNKKWHKEVSIEWPLTSAGTVNNTGRLLYIILNR